MRAAKYLAEQLRSLGFTAKEEEVKNNDWLAKVNTSLGVFAVYTNAKGKVTVQTNFITDQANKKRALWAMEQIHSKATISAVGKSVWVAYTDGSAQSGQCGWSAVVFSPEGKKDYEKLGNLGPQPNGQIAGEVEGAICVIRDAIAKKINRLLIRHDYEGVGQWGMGRWKDRDPDATRLKAWVAHAKISGVHVDFEWTRGHSGDYGNERADYLASKATRSPVVPRIKDPSKPFDSLDQASMGFA